MSDKVPPVREHHDVDFERKDVQINWLVLAGIIALILTIVTMYGMVEFQSSVEDIHAEQASTPLPVLQFRPTPPLPRLQPNPIDRVTPLEELREIQEQDAEILGTYEWVDQEAGIVKVPIDQAIELLTKGEEEENEPDR